MSTKTQTATETRSFGEASANELPQLVCVGQVDEVLEAKVSDSGNYCVQPIRLSALGAGRGQTIYFLYRPEWFQEGYKPDSMKEMEDGKGPYFVYGKMINKRGDTSYLRGLAGSQEAFDRLAGILFDLPHVEDNKTEDYLALVTQTLKEFFESNVDEVGDKVKIGYVLRQERTDTGEKGEDGKKIYILENRYVVNKFFDPTPEALARWEKTAKGSNGRTKVTYHSEPF